MEGALKGKPAEEFPIPEGIKQVAVSKYSGKLVSDMTPSDQQITDYFASFAVPTEVDDSYAGKPDFYAAEKLSQAPCQAGQVQNLYQAVLHDIDPSREVWEKAAQDWLTEHSSEFAQSGGSIQCASLTPGSSAPKISITSLKDGDFVQSTNLPVAVQASSTDGIAQVAFYLDDNLQYKQDLAPFTGNIRLPKNSLKNSYTITVRAFDQAGRIGESKITVYTTKEAATAAAGSAVVTPAPDPSVTLPAPPVNPTPDPVASTGTTSPTPAP
jgi:hypothetical protein